MEICQQGCSKGIGSKKGLKVSVTIKINQVFFIFNIRELTVKRKDLQALNLVGLNKENPTVDPIQHLDNKLFI